MYSLSSYRNSYRKSAPQEIRTFFSIPLVTEPHSQRWNKILITEYDFAVNAVMTAIHKIFTVHDLANKLLIA